MAQQRRGSTEGDATVSDDDLLVVSPKAAQHAVKAEKQNRKAAKAERRLAEAQEKALKKSLKGSRSARKDGSTKDGAADGERTEADPVTGAKVKRYIGVARVVVPVLAPLVYQAVGTARSRWDEHRARQLGVAPDELSDFTGRGAALYARIHNLSLSTRDLRTRRTGSSVDAETATAVRTFADDAENRLSDLEAAVRAAEQMPSARRRSAHAAVAAELDRVETRLLVLWGVGGPRSLPAGPADPSDAGR